MGLYQVVRRSGRGVPVAMIITVVTAFTLMTRYVEGHDGPGANVGFVKAEGGQFVVKAAGGALLQPSLRFVGTNAYFMLDAYASDNFPQHTIGTMCLAAGVELAGPLDGAKDADGNALVRPCDKGGVSYAGLGLGFPVLRTWGFRDGAPYRADGIACSLQEQPGVYNDTCFRKLDWVLHQADRAGVRLIVTLVNNWEHYGGVPQYLKWCDPVSQNKVNFYASDACKKLYKQYVSYLLNRVNVFTITSENPAGRRYGDDPTVFAWELMNEPRCAECVDGDGANKGGTVRAWLDEMSTLLKGIAPNTMVFTGEEGFDCTKWGPGITKADGYTDTTSIKRHPWMYDGSQGVCFTENTKLSNIDAASIHLWPHLWLIDASTSGTIWVEDHLRIAKGFLYSYADGGVVPSGINKPLVLGEFGSPRRQRPAYFDKWLNAMESTPSDPSNPASPPVRGDGSLVWQIICDYDQASCKNYKSTLETLYPPASDVSDVLKCHAAIANNPLADVTKPCP